MDFKGLRFEVVDADNKRVNRIRLSSVEEAAPDEAESRATGE
jgi:CBS domain containing-hemolysin-like protein